MSYQYTQPLEVSDFSGGKTDNYIEGPIQRFKEADNFYILKNHKLQTRPGRVLYDTTSNAQLPGANTRPSALIKHRENVELFANQTRNIYYLTSSWQTLLGPVSSNPALSANATTNYLSWSDWRGHTFIVSDSFCDPVKIFRDKNQNYQVRTAGMPPLELEGAIDLANDIKAKYNAHRVDATEHTTAPDATNSVTAADAHDFDSLITLVTQLVTKYAAHNADAELAAAWAYHAAQNAAPHTLSSTTAPTTIAECAILLDDLRTKYQAHDADGTSHGTDTLHQVTAQRLPQVSGSGTGNTYLYRLYYDYEYYVDDVLQEDAGPTTEVTIEDTGTGNKTISNIPVISNGTTRCYDTATITVQIYRTISGGQEFFRVGEVTNGTTSFVDSVTDDALVDNEPLYTTGGVLDNDPPPRSKFFTAVNDFGVYANLKIGTANNPNAFITSIPGDVDSVPGSFQDEVEMEITGLNNVGIYPILFCRNRTYRLEGLIDEQGRGQIFKREISRNYGTISNNSIVQTPQGLVFAGTDGFYFTDGYSVVPISINLINTYKNLVDTSSNEKKIYGEYDLAENRVLWTCQQDSSNSDNDSIFVLDLNYPLTSESVYVTHSGQGDSFRITALACYNREMVQADLRGYILKYDPDTTTDLKIDTTTAVANWNTYPIIWNYESCAYSFGTSAIIKWVPIVTIDAVNDANTTISIQSNNDDSGIFAELKEVRTRENITWGDPNVTWNDPNFVYAWNVTTIIQAKRRFPAGSMRCTLKQLKITNAYTNIYNSDNLGLSSSNGTANTVTILGGNDWPTDIVDYFISFEGDDYANEFLITSFVSDTVITVSDPNGLLEDNASTKWLIRGYRKGDIVNIISYAIKFAMISQTQTPYRGVQGSNA